MGVREVKVFFEKHGLADRIQEFDVSSATVELAAKAINCEPSRIAKSLSLMLKKLDQYIIIVVAGDARIDNKKYKAQFNERTKMIPFNEVGEIIGHEAGGVCPFAINAGIDVYLDVSLQVHQSVFTACGSVNSVVGLTLDELEKYSTSRGWVDICSD